jgi:hypothetical protein
MPPSALGFPFANRLAVGVLLPPTADRIFAFAARCAVGVLPPPPTGDKFFAFATPLLPLPPGRDPNISRGGPAGSKRPKGGPAERGAAGLRVGSVREG